MPYLVDTNVLLRWVQPHHPAYPVVQAALNTLRRRGEAIHVAPQNLIEFWNSATRPVDRNGFGFTPVRADQEVTRLENLFLLAPDIPAIYAEWRQLVVAVGVSGVQVHDARLVAVMRAHALTHILTFNTQDFALSRHHRRPSAGRGGRSVTRPTRGDQTGHWEHRSSPRCSAPAPTAGTVRRLPGRDGNNPG